MKFIQPLEIASKIMTLIEEAEEELIVVSPYINIAGWDKMIARLQKAKERNVKLTFYIRKNANNDISELLSLGASIAKVEDLHAKVYVSEKCAIVTSQNLIQYSDSYSLDIGYMTDSKEEYSEIQDYLARYLFPLLVLPEFAKITDPQDLDVRKIISVPKVDLDYISEKLFKNAEFKITRAPNYLWTNGMYRNTEVFISEKLTIKVLKKNEIWKKQYGVLKEYERKDLESQFDKEIDEEMNEKYIYISFMPVSDKGKEALVRDYRRILEGLHDELPK